MHNSKFCQLQMSVIWTKYAGDILAAEVNLNTTLQGLVQSNFYIYSTRLKSAFVGKELPVPAVCVMESSPFEVTNSSGWCDCTDLGQDYR